MLDRPILEPLFFAPFVSSVMRVEPAWIDYNGHLNMAYYNVLFDRAVDEVFEMLGCGADYVAKGFSTFTAEVHVRYLRELKEGDPVRVTFQLLDYDSKRMHYFEQLFDGDATRGEMPLPFRQLVLADGEGNVKRARAVVTGNGAPGHRDSLGRGAALEDQKHAAARNPVGTQSCVGEDRLQAQHILIKC